MSIPRLLVLTDRRRAEAAGRTLVDTVARAVDGGADTVLFREKDLPSAARRSLAIDVAGTVRAGGAQLFVASDAELAVEVGAAGVHLATVDPPTTDARLSGTDLLVGRSCHDATEVRAAAGGGVDYVTVSPVAPSGSKPGYGPALGTDGLSRLVAVADGLPVLALGGVTPATVSSWIRAGAHGVAVLGAVMGAEDPTAAVRVFLDRLADERLAEERA